MQKTKTTLLLLIAGSITFTGGIWLYSTRSDISTFDLLAVVGIGIIVLLTIIVGLKRLRDQQRGLTVDDELSKRIKERAAAHSFIGSIYIWTLLLLFFGDGEAPSEMIIGAGILCMALLFFTMWFFHSKKGISSENPY
ncbi:MAG: hypothetical protein GY751_01800 [Bacteroidetes bacterium]|nr:hypothetical protein [Bacteroidota bacterium]